MATDPAEELPYFFLGYAHTPERAWVNRFYSDLSREILERTAWPMHIPPGFMDESGIRVGDDWRRAVAGALATCRVLVPLYSPRYFTRIECGREWHAFHRRMLDHRARRGHDTTPIIPALWTPVPDRHLPASVRDIQVDFRSVHRLYEEEGLYTLIKNRSYRSTYLKVVKHLAQQIIDVAENRPLSRCSVDDIDVSQNAFEQPLENIPPFRRLTIMVAAPVLEHLSAGRTANDYGDRPQAWSPYRAELAAPLAESAATIARAHDYQVEILSADEGLTKRDWSDTETGLGLVLVDPWLAMDPAFAGQLRLVDGVGIDRVATILVWNMRDPQTRRHADEIRKELQSAAPRLLGDSGAPAALGAMRVHSADEFAAALPAVLDRAANRYLNSAQAQPPPGATGARPQLFLPSHAAPDHGSATIGGSHGD